MSAVPRDLNLRRDPDAGTTREGSGSVERELRFRAMNTDILAVLTLPEEVSAERATHTLGVVPAVFAAHERALSRFDPGAELSLLNRSGGAPTRVSPLLLTALCAAVAARDATAGLFDPDVLDALESAGYDRSFERIGDDSAIMGGRAAGPAASARLSIDREHGVVQVAGGLRLDLGGIGKGLAVDAAADLLAATALPGLRGLLVDAGGDIRVAGVDATGEPWLIGVEDPHDPERRRDAAVLALTDGAVATSSIARRRWVRGGEARHHLIDPRTGRPAATDLLAATVIAATAARAEVFAKAAVVAGRRAGAELLEAHGLTALLIPATDVGAGTEPVRVGGIDRFLAG